VRESGGGMRLTTALYYTPSGVSIQAKGIEPDVVVEPAKIEKVDAGAIQREADLRGALRNSGPEGAAAPASPALPAPGTTQATPVNPPPNIPPGTTPVARPDANSLDANTIGSDADYQLVRAIDLLRGVTLFKRLAKD
jgi:carboxyl-terminal processing protease